MMIRGYLWAAAVFGAAVALFGCGGGAGPLVAPGVVLTDTTSPPSNSTSTGSGTGGTAMPATPAVLTYATDLKPVFDQRCVVCHVPLGTYQGVKAKVDSGALERVLQDGGLMRNYARDDAQKILDWIAAGAPQTADDTGARHRCTCDAGVAFSTSTIQH